MRYELKDLRLFKAIVDARNLSAGAQALHMTASSASYRLKNLEYVVGSALFHRTSKGMVPTPAGQVLLKHTRNLLANVETMHGELTQFSANLKGSVRLLANSSSLNGFIIPSLARFLVSNTGINIDLKEKDSLSIPGLILSGDADIGIVAGETDSTYPDLHARLYAVDTLVCAAPIEHPVLAQNNVKLRQILLHDIVSLDRKSSNALFLERQTKTSGLTLNPRVHVQDFPSVLYLVEAGVGLAVVPYSVARPRAEAGRIKVVAIDEAWAVRHLYLLTHTNSPQENLIAQFSQILLNDPEVVTTRPAAVAPQA